MYGVTSDEMRTLPRTDQLTVGDGRVVRCCCYGPPGGLPVVSLAGTPGTRWERPDVITAFEQAGLRVVAPDRPGYGGSTRQPGRTVADVAADVRMVADAQGWERFAVTGFSGGGPHSLACAALLANRVSCCAVIASPAPSDAPEVDFFRRQSPGGAEDFRRALLGEQSLRPYLEGRAQDALARAEAGPRRPAAPRPPGADPASASGQPGATDPGRMERIRAMYLGGQDGWVDDNIALVRPWGFDVGSITVPVSIWHGSQDTRVPRAHAEWFLAHLPGAQGYEYPGAHDPDDADYRRILAWIAALSAADPG
jgi:pimeloyl-ACP methyl ester carboxylesterase